MGNRCRLFGWYPIMFVHKKSNDAVCLKPIWKAWLHLLKKKSWTRHPIPKCLDHSLNTQNLRAVPKMIPTIVKLNLNHCEKQRMFKIHLQIHIQRFQRPTCKNQLGTEWKWPQHVAKSCVPLLLFTHQRSCQCVSKPPRSQLCFNEIRQKNTRKIR